MTLDIQIDTPSNGIRSENKFLLNIEQGHWYQFNVKFEELHKKLICNDGILIKFEFESSSRESQTSEINGLELSPDGFSYKYIPDPTLISSIQNYSKFSEYIFNFKAPYDCKKLTVSYVGWNNKNIFLLSRPKLSKITQESFTESTNKDNYTEQDFEKIKFFINSTMYNSYLQSIEPLCKYRVKIIGEFQEHPQPINSTFDFIDKDGMMLEKQDSVEWKLNSKLNIATAIFTAPIHAKYLKINIIKTDIVVVSDILIKTEGVSANSFIELLQKSMPPDMQYLNFSFSDLRCTSLWLSTLGKVFDEDNLIKKTTDTNPTENKRIFIDRVNNVLMPLDKNYIENLKNSNLIISNFPALKLDPDIDWKADPFQSLSWRQMFQSLYWLGGYLKEGYKSYPSIETFKLYLNSWLRENFYPIKHSDIYAFNDHAVAMRAEFCINCLNDYPDLSSEEPEIFEKIISLAIADAFILDKLLGEPRFRLHNHGFFHVHALLGISLAIPEIPYSNYWIKRCIGRIIQLFRDLFDSDGFSIEQSASYQFILLRMFISTYLMLIKTNLLSDDHKTFLSKKINLIVKATFSMIHPDGYIVRLGDTTDYDGAYDELSNIISNKLPDFPWEDAIREINSRKVQEKFNIYHNSGKIISQFNRGINSSFLFVNFSDQNFSHGHYDTTSFELSIDGIRWITDSGGPFKYGISKERIFLLSSKAHNCASPNHRLQSDGPSKILQFIEKDHYRVAVIQSGVFGSDFIHLRRFIIYRDLSYISVSDCFKSRDILLNNISGYLHFEPNIDVNNSQEKSIMVAHYGNDCLTLDFSKNKSIELEVIRGKGTEFHNMCGWVNNTSSKLTPTASLEYSSTFANQSIGEVIFEIYQNPKNKNKIEAGISEPSLSKMIMDINSYTL